MSRRTRKHGGTHGKPGKHGKKAMRNQLRYGRKMAAVLSMMSGRKMSIGTKHSKSNKPHHFGSIKPVMTVNQLNNIFQALPSKFTSVKRSKKNSMRVSPTRRSSRAAAANASAKMAAAAGR